MIILFHPGSAGVPPASFTTLERFKKYCSQFGARIFGFWQGFGEGAGLKNPVTEPKRRQNTKKTASR
ncbi:MAG TPA: hypothetical protein VH597_14515, partial [Verrucomicrobiae bacterium]|nr:hypothetical protein [Verrucomicrobiae bacterium]